MSEKTIDTEQIRREHTEQVDPTAHWLYLLAVLVGGSVLMLGLIAFLGAN